MAIDVYLQIDGIKGESQDDKHKDWIEITSAQWGVIQPRSATASTGGGHTAERCELRSITLTKLADLSSPILMQHLRQVKLSPKRNWRFSARTVTVIGSSITKSNWTTSSLPASIRRYMRAEVFRIPLH